MSTNPIPPDPVVLALSKCYAFLLARRQQRLAAQEKAQIEKITPEAGNFGESTATGAKKVTDEPQPTQS